MLFSCAKNPEKEADDKLKLFIESLEKQNFEEAKKHTAPQAQEVLVVVEEDAKKYQKENNKPQKISYEILERNFAKESADYKLRILVGEQAKEETINLVFVNNVWLVAPKPQQIAILRFVVFFGIYDQIVVLVRKPSIKITYKKTKKKSKKKSKKRTYRR